VLTNDYQANDTYALSNNDIDSPMKTFARFAEVPPRVRAGEPFSVTGLAQVGVSGLAAVQVWLHPAAGPLPPDDPNHTRGDWRDAEMLPPPQDWGGGLGEGRLPAATLQLDPAAGIPRTWPLRYTLAHWRATLPGVPPGAYLLRCRSIDQNGIAQPLPRPFAKSGRAVIQEVAVTVVG